MGARQEDRKREEDGELKQKVGQLHILSSLMKISWATLEVKVDWSFIFILLLLVKATFLTSKGEPSDEAKLSQREVALIQWETEYRFYGTTLSRNRTDLDKCNWIGKSLYSTREKGWFAACQLSSNMSCLCVFVCLWVEITEKRRRGCSFGQK